MTHGALAMFVGAILFPKRDEIGDDANGAASRIRAIRANSGPRRPLPGDPEMAEDDYYRFLNAPRG